MSTRTSALAALTLVAGLLTGCGHPLTTVPAARAMAPAFRAAASTAMPSRLTLDDVIVKRAERREDITIKAHDKSKKVTLEVSSFFPYYVPMYSEAILNGRTVKLDKDTARSLADLLHEADTTDLSDEARGGLRMMLYGMDFAAHHWNRE